MYEVAEGNRLLCKTLNVKHLLEDSRQLFCWWAAVNPPIVARDEAKANSLLELRQSAVTSHLL
jgi:hypothetical protein